MSNSKKKAGAAALKCLINFENVLFLPSFAFCQQAKAVSFICSKQALQDPFSASSHLPLDRLKQQNSIPVDWDLW